MKTLLIILIAIPIYLSIGMVFAGIFEKLDPGVFNTTTDRYGGGKRRIEYSNEGSAFLAFIWPIALPSAIIAFGAYYIFKFLRHFWQNLGRGSRVIFRRLNGDI
jgi:hypothetical protein